MDIVTPFIPKGVDRGVHYGTIYSRYNHENPGKLKSGARTRDMNDCLGSRNEINQKLLLKEQKKNIHILCRNCTVDAVAEQPATVQRVA
ncbi:hypothetical protein SFRURICE_001071, partial [Spodoptera frugiperda]